MRYPVRVRRTATLTLGVLALMLVTAVMPRVGPIPAHAAPLAAVSDGSIRTVAGTGSFALFPDGIPATSATIARSTGVAVLPGGGFLIAAFGAHCVLKVDGAGLISTVAGTCTTSSTSTSAGDGLVATAPGVKLNSPGSVTVLADGGFLISEELGGCVRKVDSARIITTVAGICGQPGFNGATGVATVIKLQRPQATVALAGGAFMVADFDNGCVRLVSARGISTVAGICGTLAMGADGPAATASALGGPVGLAAMPDGGFVLTEYFANRVRRVTPDGRITTIAGSGPFAFGFGTGSFAGDGGPATEAKLNGPTAVAPAAGGGYLISDAENNRIRWVLPDQPATIRTLAGTGPSGFGAGGFDGDGGFPATRQLNRPTAIAITPDGGFLFADQLNRRIRAIAPLAIQNTRRPFVQVLSPVGGPATTGGLLLCQAGDWSANVFAFRYTWLVGGRPTTETGQTLSPSPDMAGQQVACRVTGSTYSAALTVDSAGQTVLAAEVQKLTLRVEGSGDITYYDPTALAPLQTVCPPTCTAFRLRNSVVVLLPTAADGWTFKEWQGGCGLYQACSLSVDRDLQATAVFVVKPVLSVALPTGSSVTSDDGRVTCAGGGRGGCQTPVDYNQGVILTATAPAGAHLDGWDGCDMVLAAGACAVGVMQDRSVTPRFVVGAAPVVAAAPATQVAATAADEITMRFNIIGNGRIEWSSYDQFGRPGKSGLFESSDCSQGKCQFSIARGMAFKLTHTGLASGFGAPDVFWETLVVGEPVCIVRVCTFKLNGSVNFTARFVPPPRLYIRLQGDAYGWHAPKKLRLPDELHVSGAGIDCESTCDVLMTDGTKPVTVTLTYRPSFLRLVRFEPNERPLSAVGCTSAVNGQTMLTCTIYPYDVQHSGGGVIRPAPLDRTIFVNVIPQKG